MNGEKYPYSKFGGKEYSEELGLDSYDFGARNYDPALGRWMNLDPLADKYPGWSPYNFTMDNPVKYVDPDGMAPDIVKINGDGAEAATSQLNASTNLDIKRDKGTGKLSITGGKAITKADKKLQAAITDQDRTVEVSSVNISVTKEGKKFLGGAFGGNDGKTAWQTVNPDDTKFLDMTLNRGVGTSMLHEVNEAYIGLTEHPGAKAATFNTKTGKWSKGYTESHNSSAGLDSRRYRPSQSTTPRHNNHPSAQTQTFWFDVTNQQGQTKPSPHYTIPFSKLKP